MIVKTFQIKNIDNDKYNFFLLYGENEGFKNQTIQQLSSNFKPNILRYEESEIVKNNENFFAELNNTSFFDKKKVIIINRITDKILNILEDALEKSYKDIRIILNSGILEKKSKLRNKFEKAKNLICIPFYSDNSITLSKIANDFFRDIKIAISQECLNLIVDRCRGDRENLKNELQKIENFAKSKKKITISEILKLTNLAENYSYGDLSDQCLSKNLRTTINILNENNYNSDDCISVIRVMLAKVKRLVKLKEDSMQESNIDNVISNYKPPIFWKEKDIVKSQIKAWDLKNIQNFMYLLSELELLIKKENQSAVNILRDFILTHARPSN